MKKYLFSVLAGMFDRSMELNRLNILGMLESKAIPVNLNTRLLDLGCDDGQWTRRLALKLWSDDIHGVETVDERIKTAKALGVRVVKSDLNDKLPYPSDYFDVVHANQVIEHVSNLDQFVSEIYRVLKPGGYTVVSTENGSSWHNIFASVMGWQIFSSTNISAKRIGIGNRLAIHKNEVQEVSWTHKTIFYYSGLKEFFNVHGFSKLEVAGAGYYPLPAEVGRWDVRHAHFITIKAVKQTAGGIT